jgi:hypothetical protein
MLLAEVMLTFTVVPVVVVPVRYGPQRKAGAAELASMYPVFTSESLPPGPVAVRLTV